MSGTRNLEAYSTPYSNREDKLTAGRHQRNRSTQNKRRWSLSSRNTEQNQRLSNSRSDKQDKDDSFRRSHDMH